MDDIRAHSPTDHVLAGIELLHRLSLLDADTDADAWFQPAPEPWLAAKRPAPALHDPHMPFELEEAEACDPSMYDPFLFPPSQPASPTRPVFSLPGDRRKVSISVRRVLCACATRRHASLGPCARRRSQRGGDASPLCRVSCGRGPRTFGSAPDACVFSSVGRSALGHQSVAR